MPPSAFDTVSTPFGSKSLESLRGWSSVAWPRDAVADDRGGGEDALP
jgi:hypothetical protein